MKRSTYIVCCLLIGWMSLLLGCEGLEEHYSTNPAYRLSFSMDTLAFDTVFSSVGSTTRQFMVYNPNNEPLEMEQVMLASGEASGFRMNLDGRKGSRFDRVGIAANDSMYVFVEVTVNPNGQNQPLLIQDSVLFDVNGIRQSVLLEAYGQDVHLCKGGVTLAQDTLFAADRPYLIYDSLVVAEGATLTLGEGVTFYMHDQANLIVYGTLRAEGTPSNPVTLRGDRLDYILNDVLPYDRTPGQWGGICFRASSYQNELAYTIVRNGTNGILCEPSTPDQPKLRLRHAQVTNMANDLLVAVNSDVEATDTEFSNAGGSVATLVGGTYYFAHCTLANYMSLTARRSISDENTLDSKCLYLLHEATVNGQGPYPIQQAYFDNCLIDGSFGAGDLLTGGEIQLSAGDYDYRFNHCVLKAKPSDDSRFNEVLFVSESPLYRATGGQANKYAYDFRLDTVAAPGVGQADVAISRLYPLDRYGVNRLESANGPTIGAYEFVPKEAEEAKQP